MIIFYISKQSFFSFLFYRLIIQIYASHHEEFQSRSFLFVVSVIQHLYTFFVYVENDRRFPFSLVLSISYLDHFRGISSRRSPSISPLLVNEKVVDHFFEIDDKKRKKRREEKRSGESISGLKTRTARFISKPVSLLSAPVFRVGWWRSLTLLYRQGKNPGRIYLPSSISNTGVQYLEVERRGQKNDAQVVQLIFPC